MLSKPQKVFRIGVSGGESESHRANFNLYSFKMAEVHVTTRVESHEANHCYRTTIYANQHQLLST